MRNPLGRIGFGGYLELAAKFPKFIHRIFWFFVKIYDTMIKEETYTVKVIRNEGYY